MDFLKILEETCKVNEDRREPYVWITGFVGGVWTWKVEWRDMSGKHRISGRDRG
jgi:hypothetical protein